MKFTYAYTRLQVANYEACLQFYRELLEFEVTFVAEDDGYAELDTGTTKLTLLKREKLKEIMGSDQELTYGESRNAIALSFEVHDLDQACQHLKAQGVTLINTPWSFPDWGYKSCFLRDPDGNLIEITQFLS